MVRTAENLSYLSALVLAMELLKEDKSRYLESALHPAFQLEIHTGQATFTDAR